MSNKIIWNDDMDMVYGVQRCFENEKDFENKVSKEYTKLTETACLVSNIEIKSCICTGKGLGAETITPLDEIDIEVNTFYIADVEKAEV